MNVALVHRRFTEHGGTERFLVGLARFLRDGGHEVHVYCERVDIEEPGLRFVRLPPGGPGAALKLLGLWSRSGRAAQGGHDVVMGFGRTRGHQVWRAGGGAHAAFLDACRPAWRLDPLAHVERALDAQAAREARVVISPSAVAARDLTRCYGVAPERIVVLHNGVDADRFRPDPGLRAAARAAWGVSDAPVIAFLGTGFVRKGLDEALAVARGLGWRAVVMGQDARLGSWRRRHPEALFMGPVEQPERWLPGADVLLLPTRYEPFGNVCLEAMACGVPAVTTPVNGVTEVFPEPWLVAQGVEALAEATRAAVEAGDALRGRCRAVAEARGREVCYSGVERVLARVAEEVRA